MQRIILSSFMFLFSIAAFCFNPQLPENNTEEQMKSDSIKEIVNEIELPVININTLDSVEPSYKKIEHPEGCVGESITDNKYVKGKMTIHKNKNLIYDSGDYDKKKSGMRIKVRGNTSADFPYKSYKIKTEIKTDFFNRENEIYESRSWVLLNVYSTRDLRTIAGCHVAKLMGMEWEPEHEFVNLIINGEYRGLYLLSESVEASEGRCKLKDETGLLIEADPYWWKEILKDPVIKTDHLPYAMGYSFKNPEPVADDPILDEIKDYLNAFEDSLYNNKDIDMYVDLKSFATWILTHDLLGTSDGVGSNIYVMKDDFLDGPERYSSKLRMGPLWDFDSLFETPDKWCTCHELDFFYFNELFKRPEFVEEYQRLWSEVHEDIATKTITYIKDFIEKYGKAIDESRKVSPPDPWVWRNTVNDNLIEIEEWFDKRVAWMDNVVPEMLEMVSVSQVDMQSEIENITIFTIDGRMYGTIKGHNYDINAERIKRLMPQMLPGIYILQTEYSDGHKTSRKFAI